MAVSDLFECVCVTDPSGIVEWKLNQKCQEAQRYLLPVSLTCDYNITILSKNGLPFSQLLKITLWYFNAAPPNAA